MADLSCLQREKLESILMTLSPSSQEEELTSFITRCGLDQWSCRVDKLGNALISLNGEKNSSVLLTAHCDEIGLQVIYITEEGYIRFRGVGGVDLGTLAGQTVTILNSKDRVNGVICKAPIHVKDKDAKASSIEFSDLWIDIGCSSLKEAEGLVSIGDMIGFAPKVTYLGDRRLSCKALDDKIGVYAILSAMERLSRGSIENNVTAVFSVQEEVGSKGIAVAAETIHPSWGICVDVGVATDCPNISKESFGELKLGGGPALVYCADTNRRLTDKAASLLEAKKIPFQKSAGLRVSGSTDARSLQTAVTGVPCVLLLIPIRSMHTPSEVCDLYDVANTIEALVEIIKCLDYEC